MGTRFGPEVIRSVSHLLRPYYPSQDVSTFDYLSVIDYKLDIRARSSAKPDQPRPSYLRELRSQIMADQAKQT